MLSNQLIVIDNSATVLYIFFLFCKQALIKTEQLQRYEQSTTAAPSGLIFKNHDPILYMILERCDFYLKLLCAAHNSGQETEVWDELSAVCRDASYNISEVLERAESFGSVMLEGLVECHDCKDIDYASCFCNRKLLL